MKAEKCLKLLRSCASWCSDAAKLQNTGPLLKALYVSQVARQSILRSLSSGSSAGQSISRYIIQIARRLASRFLRLTSKRGF